MKLDIHVHSAERSWCAVATEREQIEAAMAHGLDGLVFTDHSTLTPPEHLKRLNARVAPFRVYNGIEVTVRENGRSEDLLVIGCADRRLEAWDWKYADLWRFARANGAFLSLCHPFRYADSVSVDVSRYPVDAVEARSINIRPELGPVITAFAQEHGLPLICCSDSHTQRVTGLYFIELDSPPADERVLAEVLRHGNWRMGENRAVMESL